MIAIRVSPRLRPALDFDMREVALFDDFGANKSLLGEYRYNQRSKISLPVGTRILRSRGKQALGLDHFLDAEAATLWSKIDGSRNGDGV